MLCVSATDLSKSQPHLIESRVTINFSGKCPFFQLRFILFLCRLPFAIPGTVLLVQHRFFLNLAVYTMSTKERGDSTHSSALCRRMLEFFLDTFQFKCKMLLSLVELFLNACRLLLNGATHS